MRDGDAQQQNEILIALSTIFVNTIEGGCKFHIGKEYDIVGFQYYYNFPKIRLYFCLL